MPYGRGKAASGGGSVPTDSDGYALITGQPPMLVTIEALPNGNKRLLMLVKDGSTERTLVDREVPA